MSQQLRIVPWYDRNGQPIFKRWEGLGTAPHALAQRWMYTVPKTKMAYLEFATALVRRATVAGTEKDALAMLELELSGQTSYKLLWAQIATNGVGDKDRMTIGQTLLLYEGDAIKGFTKDLSTGGTCDFQIAAKVTEFDAFPIEELPFRAELPKEDLQEPKRWWQWW